MSTATQSMAAFTSSNNFTGCPSIVSFDSPGFPNFLITDDLDDGIVKQIVLQGGADSSEFTATSPRTSSGIGIGATLDEFTTAYPTLTDLDDYYVPHYALSDGNGTWINFSVVEGLVQTIVVHGTAFLPREICG